MKSLLRGLLGLLVFLPACASPARDRSLDPVMRAHFWDVGQGDSTLLEFPHGAVLIDTGGPDDPHVASLVKNLRDFFNTRPDLNNTLDAVYVSHWHIDHTRGLRAVVENFIVKRYIDSDMKKGSGKNNPLWLKKEVQSGHRAILVREISQSDVEEADRDNGQGKVRIRDGLTDGDLDPISAKDPQVKIVALQAMFEEAPENWGDKAFQNLNNQSLVLRVSFGKSSFLFTGDLQEEGIGYLLEYYKGTRALKADVYKVGHHGSYNATNAELIDAISPRIALILCGKWTDGKATDDQFSTWAYGHPRMNIVQMLDGADSMEAALQPRQVKTALKAKDFRDTTIRKKIYASGWDGEVTVEASLSGEYSVKTSSN